MGLASLLEAPVLDRPIITVAVFAVLLRLVSSATRTRPSHGWSLLGWIFLGLSSWLMASTFGAWSPFGWSLIPAGLAFALTRARRDLWIAPLTEAAAVALVGFQSHPPLRPMTIAMAGAAIVAVGAATDLGLRPLQSRGSRLPLYTLGLLGVALFVTTVPSKIGLHLFQHPEQALRFGISPELGGKRIVLPGGSVAFYDVPSGEPRAGALFFHGYHEKGVEQPAALVVRRALLEAGFLVLSLDAPGFGASPKPAPDADVTAWDPVPAALEAYDALKERLGSDKIFFVGHSFGTADVGRMLATDRPARGAAMLGAGFSTDKPLDGRYWYGRFNRVYKYDPPISYEKFQAIAAAYHVKEPVVARIPKKHAPLLFVVFADENRDLAQTRDRFFARIAGPKKRVMCDSSHYFNSERIQSLLVGDPTRTGRLAKIFKENFDPEAPAVAGAEPAK